MIIPASSPFAFVVSLSLAFACVFVALSLPLRSLLCTEKHTLEATVNATSTWKGGGWKGGRGGEGEVVTLGVCLFLQDGGGGHASTSLSCWCHGVRCGGG